jgi:dethiobiotin synthetase
MTRPIIVTGTDTGVGKTIFAAALAAALDATYWKPIQSGLDGEFSDSEAVSRLGVRHVLPEAYRLTEPLSPHRAAELDRVAIDPGRLALPDISGKLVIEGAGGLMVPVTRSLLFIDLFRQWHAPVILVARTALGTINHSLLSVEALRARHIPILGIAFVGEANEDNEATIAALAGVRRLGRLPLLDPLGRDGLAAAFAAHFRIEDFG